MSSKIIVCDASPIIALIYADSIKVLSHFFHRIIVPRDAIAEWLARPDLPVVQQLNQLIQTQFFEIHPTPVFQEAILEELDLGKKAVIQLALNLGTAILMEAEKGRSIARKLNISVIGPADLVVASYQKGLAPELEELVNDLKSTGDRLSDTLIPELCDIVVLQ